MQPYSLFQWFSRPSLPLLRSLVLGCSMALLAPATFGQTFPSKVVRYVVPDSPGSGGDIMGRLVASGMTEALNQQVIVDNRAGASSNLGAELVARSAADGYTMLAVSTTLSANASLYKNLGYDLARDLAPVTQLALTPHVLVVHPSLPVNSVAEFIKLVKAKPGTINYSSPGSGTSAFIPAEIFKRVADVDIVHVPYKGGGPALQAIIAGQVQAYFAPSLTAVPPIKQGLVRALALTSVQKLPLMPDLPTLAELGIKDIDFANSLGLMVPTKTPEASIGVLNRAAVAALKKPDIAKKVNDLGAIIVGSSPTDYGTFVRREMTTLADLFKRGNVQPD